MFSAMFPGFLPPSPLRSRIIRPANTPRRGQIAFARSLDLPEGSSIRLILFPTGDHSPDIVLLHIVPRRHTVPILLVIRFRESLYGGRFAVLFRHKVIQRIKILDFLLRLHGLQMGLALLLGEIEEAGHVQRHVRIRVQQIQLHRVEHNLAGWILVPVTIS